MTIQVYVDEGAGPRSVRLLIKALKTLELDRKFSLKTANRISLAEDSWEEETILLIFPGGRDTPYQQALNGSPNSKIRQYVENGGSYLGICAGGYYGSAQIEFEKGHALEVIDERELGFFPGLARGSAYGPNRFKYEDESGCHAATLSWHGEEALDEASIYFNGGCAFIDAEAHQNTEILARYSDLKDSPAAIVECSVGKGKAILSGVHPEYSYEHIHQVPSIPKTVLDSLKDSEPNRGTLFASLLNRALYRDEFPTQRRGDTERS